MGSGQESNGEHNCRVRIAGAFYATYPCNSVGSLVEEPAKQQ